jgi:hypothetical protein
MKLTIMALKIVHTAQRHAEKMTLSIMMLSIMTVSVTKFHNNKKVLPSVTIKPSFPASLY